jgi:hypothetical protein
MPSPIGHAIAGLVVHTLAARGEAERFNLTRASLMVGAALAPDLDLLFRFVDGRNHHQAETHGIGCALGAGLLVFLVARIRGSVNPGRLGLAVGLAWFSHTVLDYFGRDTHPPIGLMALWPFSDAYFKFPWPFFLDIGRRLDLATAIGNAKAAVWEMLILLPVLAAAWRLRSRERA